MIELASQQCTALSKNHSVLDQNKTAEYLLLLAPQWQLNKKDKNISFTFTFKDYYQTMAFVNVVAQIAHQQNHHPDLLVRYNQCNITYSTHSISGLSVNDFICAAKINAVKNL